MSTVCKEDLSFYSSGQEIFFDTKEKVPIADLIESLQGLEKIAGQSARLFSNLLEVEITAVKVFIEKVEEGSLWQKYALKLFFKDEEAQKAFAEKWSKKFREAKPVTKIGLLLSVGLVAAVGYGLWHAINSSSPAGTNITVNNSGCLNIITVGAEAYEKSPEEFTKIVENSFSDKKSLAKNSLKAIEPARNNGGNVTYSSQEADESSKVTITQDVVSKTPDKLDFTPDEKNTEYKDASIQLRALDLDNTNKGWAAVVPGIADRRVQTEIAPGVELSRLAVNKTIRADISVNFRFDARKNAYKPVKIIIESLVEEDS